MNPDLAPEATEALQRLTWKEAVIGLAVMVAFFVFAKIAGWLLRRALSRESHWGGPVFAASKLLTYLLVFIGVVTGLTLMGLPLSSLLLTSSALLVGLGFSLQHVARDFVGGVILLVEQPIRRNDFVTFGDTAGTVREIGLRATHLRTRDGMDLIVPNHLLVTSQVTNHSHPLERTRLLVDVPVSLLENVDAVSQVLATVADEHREVLRDPPPTVSFEAIDSSHFQFSLIAWVDAPPKILRVASELRFAIIRAFRAHGIRLPTPELLVHVPSRTVSDERSHHETGPVDGPH